MANTQPRHPLIDTTEPEYRAYQRELLARLTRLTTTPTCHCERSWVNKGECLKCGRPTSYEFHLAPGDTEWL